MSTNDEEDDAELEDGVEHREPAEEKGSPEVERVFAALRKLTARIDDNSWEDRVVGKFSKNSNKEIEQESTGED